MESVMDDITLKALLTILVDALSVSLGRGKLIAEFQRKVWDEQPDAPDPVLSVLKELAYDLDFYEAAPKIRDEDMTFFGNERLETEIKAAFGKLRNLGIDVQSVSKVLGAHDKRIDPDPA
jgi:hypothetical protein